MAEDDYKKIPFEELDTGENKVIVSRADFIDMVQEKDLICEEHTADNFMSDEEKQLYE